MTRKPKEDRTSQNSGRAKKNTYGSALLLASRRWVEDPEPAPEWNSRAIEIYPYLQGPRFTLPCAIWVQFPAETRQQAMCTSMSGEFFKL